MKKLLLIAVTALSLQVNAQLNYQRVYSGGMAIGGADVEWSAIDQSYVMSSIDSVGLTISKVDVIGMPMWNKSYSFPNAGLGYVAKLVVGGDGNIYICTQYYEFSSGNTVNYLLIAVDRWLNPLWSKVYQTQSEFVYDEHQLSFLPDGNLMITESVTGHIGFIKTDLQGNVLLSNLYRDDPQVEGKTPGFDAAAFPDGSMIFTGKRTDDIMIVRTDANGAVVWTSVMNSGGNYYHTKSVAALWDGTSILSGFAASGAGFLMRMDVDGTIMWYKEYMVNNSFGIYYDVQQIDANTFMTVSNSGYQSMLSKFNINGQMISTVMLEDLSAYAVGGMHYCVNPAGNIAWPFYAYDSLSAWQQFNGLHIMTVMNNGGCGISTVTVQESGSAITPVQLTVPIYTVPQNIVVSTVAPTVTQNIIQVENFCWIIGMEEPTPDPEFGLNLQSNHLVYGSSLTFSLENFTGDATYTIHDLNGKEVTSGKTSSNSGNQITISDVATFANGMYVLSVVAGENRMSEKFVVQ